MYIITGYLVSKAVLRVSWQLGTITTIMLMTTTMNHINENKNVTTMTRMTIIVTITLHNTFTLTGITGSGCFVKTMRPSRKGGTML